MQNVGLESGIAKVYTCYRPSYKYAECASPSLLLVYLLQYSEKSDKYDSDSFTYERDIANPSSNVYTCDVFIGFRYIRFDENFFDN